MEFHNEGAELYIPDDVDESGALSRTTHLAIGAHQDDLEIMAYHGVVFCYGHDERWFSGVTCTNGAGSPRTGMYAGTTDEGMMAVRRLEQRKAAIVGQYAAVAQLNHASATIKDPTSSVLREDLVQLCRATKPQIVYTHNPADKHPSHIAVVLSTISALREVPAHERPKQVYGCEVWRNLDWMADEEKVALDVSQRPNLAASLVGLFDSQISGGKRYDVATLGRWQANATYFASHGVDTAGMLAFAMDLTPLVTDETLDVVEYVLGHVDRFRADVESNLKAQLGLTS